MAAAFNNNIPTHHKDAILYDIFPKNAEDSMNNVPITQIKCLFDGSLHINTGANGGKTIQVLVTRDSPLHRKITTLTSIPMSKGPNTQETIPMEIEVKENQHWNMAIGIISAPQLNGSTIQQIIESNALIVDCQRLTKINADTRRPFLTHTYKLTFCQKELPQFICIGDHLRFPVRPHYPLPQYCIKCLSYDHFIKKCPKTNIAHTHYTCKKCGKNVKATSNRSSNTNNGTTKQNTIILESHDCSNPTCPNCEPSNNRHSPMDNECPKRKIQIQIIKYKEDNNVTFKEARHAILSNNDEVRNVTFNILSIIIKLTNKLTFFLSFFHTSIRLIHHTKNLNHKC